MGYVQLTNGGAITSFSKAVISVWFRIPASTLAILTTHPYPITGDPTVASDGMNGAYYNPPLYRIIPLITFGSVEIDTFGNPVQPSFVGIDCIFDGAQTLCCNLQTPVNGSFTSAVGSTGADRPGCFYMSGSPGNPGSNFISADHWHHALISFDIGGSCSAAFDQLNTFTSSNTFNWSLDDVNKVGTTLEPAGNNDGLSSTQIICNWLTSGVGYPGDPSPTDADTASFSGGYIAAGNTIGLPAKAEFVNSVYNVEMAEFQLFTGVTLDTSVEANRRAFIKSSLSPENPTAAQALLGQAPDILFHGSNNWIQGLNTGTAGLFNATGTIVSYTPGP